MTFNSYLKSKRTLLIYYFLFHGIALFVNVFGIEWDVSNNKSTQSFDDFRTTHILTTKKNDFNDVQNPSSQFWPIVPFYKSEKEYNPTKNVDADLSEFKGIFYQYDISEFLAYTALIFLILYLRWENKYRIKK